jgi:hypothetical protein
MHTHCTCLIADSFRFLSGDQGSRIAHTSYMRRLLADCGAPAQVWVMLRSNFSTRFHYHLERTSDGSVYRAYCSPRSEWNNDL